MISAAIHPAAEAQDKGLVDAIVEGDLLAGAVAFARKMLADARVRKAARRDLSVDGGQSPRSSQAALRESDRAAQPRFKAPGTSSSA